MPNSVEQLHEGQELPQLERHISAEDLVRYAGASNDYSRQHWDHAYMVSEGFPGVIVHGWLTFAVMCEAVHGWIVPETADITSFSVRYHRPHLPGHMSCGGRVARIVTDAPAPHAELELWARDASGATTASARVMLTFAS